MSACSSPTWLMRGSSATNGEGSRLSYSWAVTVTASMACCVDLAPCSSRSTSESWAGTSHLLWSQLSKFGLRRSDLCLAVRSLIASRMDTIGFGCAGQRLETVPFACCAREAASSQSVGRRRARAQRIGASWRRCVRSRRLEVSESRQAHVWRAGGRAGARTAWIRSGARRLPPILVKQIGKPANFLG